MIEVILGLLDECLETEREEVNLLKLAYDVIDEGRNMIEASTVEEANKGSPMSKILKKFYEKKRDETSKWPPRVIWLSLNTSLYLLSWFPIRVREANDRRMINDFARFVISYNNKMKYSQLIEKCV